MQIRLLTQNLVIMVAYFVSGQAGLWLAIPPSNATVIWPAAGVALVSLIILGRGIVPGLFLGALCIQTLSYLDATTAERVYSSLFIGAIMSAGTILQALVGAVLVRDILARDSALLKERSILMFYLLAGPAACVISATVGIATLWLTDIITLTDLTLSWTRWWIGDSMGVLIVSPILFCLFGEPPQLWRQRISTVAIPLCILSSLAFITFRFSNLQEMRHVENEFERNAVRFTDELRASIESNIEATNELKEYFDTSVAVSAQTFSDYTRPKLQRHPRIQALEWVPRITSEQRETFEATADILIRGRNDENNLTAAPAKPAYYPIQYVEPYTGNEDALGYDISSNKVAFAAAGSTCVTGSIAVTEALSLIQHQDDPTGIVFYAPVFRKDAMTNRDPGCETLSGFASSVFRLGQELNNITERLPDLMKVNITLRNESQIVYTNIQQHAEAHTIPSLFEFRRIYSFPVANQYWSIEFTPQAGFITMYSTWAVWMILVGGLIIAGIAGAGLLMLTGRTLQTETLITQRTRQLNDEISERREITNLLVMENSFLEMIAQDYSMQQILDEITRSIESLIPDSLCSILLLDSAGMFLRHSSAPNLPRDYLDAIDGLQIGPNIGSCGTAAFLNRQVIVTDIATDPLWQNYADLALNHGLKACWSTPITGANQKVLGTFALYFNTVKHPDRRELDLINRIAQIAAITIMRKQSEEQLTYHASHDSLTGLVNRHEFERRVSKLLERAQNNSDEHALYFMDLDQFKIVNDSCGHAAGDEMLRQLTAVLQNFVRKRDTLARLGGDEFGVLIEYCSLDDAYRIATTLQKAIQDYQFVWEGHMFRVGVSIGLVPVTNSATTLGELLRDADAACYMAKELGRNRIHIYHREDEHLVRRSGEMQWIARLQRALDEDRFTLYAQPIEALDGSPKKHYELLIRMIDEQGKLIPPGMFLPAAERYNLISRLDAWVIRRVFEAVENNRDSFADIDLVSINLSGQSLTSPEILDGIIARLNESGIDQRKICFEITETAAISNMTRAIKFISALKLLGCRFALDDFGSGLSSFGYLKNLPVDYLKIDGMFVRNIITDQIDHAMVKSINEVGHIMGMKTIAEFVENDEIRTLVRQIGVDYAQGYGIGVPQPFSMLIGTPPSTA